jgi:hypothetical protein
MDGDELAWFRARARPVLVVGSTAAVLMVPIAVGVVATSAVSALGMVLLFGLPVVALGIFGIVGGSMRRQAEAHQPAPRLVLLEPPAVVETWPLR